VLPQRDVTILARHRVLPSGEFRCTTVECYRRRRQTPDTKTILAPTLCVGWSAIINGLSKTHATHSINQKAIILVIKLKTNKCRETEVNGQYYTWKKAASRLDKAT